MGIADTIGALVKIGFKVAVSALALVVITAMVWSGTYNSYTNGSYVDAALGVVLLLGLAVAVLWAVYRRVDSGVLPTSLGSTSESASD